MKTSTHDALLSFLGGASWAFAIIGTWVTFQSFIFLGLVTALMFSFIFIFIALFIIVVLQNLSLSRDRYNEMLKQTEMIEEIKKSISHTSLDT